MVGTTVSHYEILAELGTGGMGVVFLAEDLRLHRKVALKFLAPHTAQDPGSRARFEREAQAASVLDHPHIATIYEIGEWKDQLFIAMAYCSGKSLKDHLAGGPLSPIDATSIGEQIASALAAAHARGIVHRDLKPANVMVMPTGDVKVLDFGLAKLMTDDEATALRMTAAGTTLGTLAYMSPEQVRGENVDQRTDVWAFGVVFYEMLAGSPPFTGSSSWAVMQAILADDPPPVLTKRPEAPPELERIVARALIKDRTARVVSADEIQRDLRELLARDSAGARLGAAPERRVGTMHWARTVVPATAVLLALGISVGWWVHRTSQERWAREKALPEIIRLAEEEQFLPAFELAVKAERHLPGDRLLSAQWPTISRSASIVTMPSGAVVSYRPYATADATWRRLGTTPLKDVRVPRGFFHWRIERDGYTTVEDVGPRTYVTLSPPFELAYTLEKTGSAPPDMVRVSTTGAPFTVFIPGLDHLPPIEIQDFWIDRHEVTNRQFKQFVEAGGYRRPELWQAEFVKDGRRLAWQEAVALFRDSTGRPGPASWELGSYPEGQDDYPVTGLSWYEAAAYARYAGKALPTIFHWSRAAAQQLAGEIVPVSNFGGRGPQPVGRSGSMSRFGTFDMAGNVKEWCWNAATGDMRYILGGAWNDPGYMFTDAYAQSPFRREATFGFRCIKLTTDSALPAAVAGPIDYPSRDFSKEKPVNDEVFRAYAGLYAYDRTDLAVAHESRDDSSDDWTKEKVTFSAAYGGERVIAHLFLPKRSRPPYQTVVYFPGAGALQRRSSDRELEISRFDFIIKSGRAVLSPVYKSTYERSDDIKSDYPNPTAAWRDHVIMWSKDLRRSIDYLETRGDIDRGKVAYVGVSWGGGMGAILPALEPRLKAAVLLVGGFYLQRALPEADAINFAPRVKIPVLMLNGRYDFFFPTEASQLPLFRLLGAPSEHKRHVIYETGHTIPRSELIKETLDWLDRYLGPPS